ncbi:MAG: hypothetical protein K5896_07750 [Prevotella sp.]|nr:hypothetical protein [Prevotella sp.]
MKEKEYQKPAIQIVGLRQRTAILFVSGGEAKINGYEATNTQDWETSEE